MTFIAEASRSKVAAVAGRAARDLPETATELQPPGPQNSHPVRVFVSFDTEHDEQLCAMLLEHSRLAASGFEVVGRSEPQLETDLWSDRTRQQIGDADQLIVICGEHTESSAGVFAELRIAREERTPHFLLWGRRELMCTRPMGAQPAEGMYSWTPHILRERLAYTQRTNSTSGSTAC